VTVPILISLTIICYLLGVLFLTQRYTLPESAESKIRNYVLRARLATVSALVLHAIVIVQVIADAGLAKLNLVTSLTIIALILSVLSAARGSQTASLLLRPVVFGFAVVSLFLLSVTPMEWGPRFVLQPALATHVTLALLAASVLTMATLYGLQLLYLNRLLKNHSAKAISQHMPPLMAVEQYFFRLLIAGFGLLTLAMLVGFIFMENLFAPGQLHKTAFTLMAWILFGAILLSHYWRGLRGKRAVLMTIAASACLILAYFGSRFVRDVLLS